jgi:hypothetical protein
MHGLRFVTCLPFSYGCPDCTEELVLFASRVFELLVVLIVLLLPDSDFDVFDASGDWFCQGERFSCCDVHSFARGCEKYNVNVGHDKSFCLWSVPEGI